jgi:hypothetical protein
MLDYHPEFDIVILSMGSLYSLGEYSRQAASSDPYHQLVNKPGWNYRLFNAVRLLLISFKVLCG